MTIVRFAPSPTGRLHIGNARTALLNWLFAKSAQGRFVLRFDDTDRLRAREEFVAAAVADLAWLGIVPDLTVRQSEREGLYAAAAERLKAAGRLYPAYETPDELERRRKRQLARGLPPIYDRAALRLSRDERAALEAAGRKPHWRFRLDGRTIGWNDLCRGPQHVDTSSLSDPVLAREDGSYLYTLPSVVDDIDLSITHVIRGEDHLTNTAVQIELFEALGHSPPVFAHHNLLASGSGEALSKRLGALSIVALREAGYEPMAVASLALLVGSAEEIRPYSSLADLAPHVDLRRLSHGTARFDPHDLDALNARLLHTVPYEAVADRFAAMGIGGGEAFWLAIRDNLGKLPEARLWWDVVAGPVRPSEPIDADLLTAAADLLPPEPWDEAVWATWTSAVAHATGRKGKTLYRPLRLALTGLDHGPEMKRLLPLIGRQRTSDRLRALSGASPPPPR